MKDITGQSFGNLEVLRFDYKEKGHDYYLCRCNLCGNVVSLRGSNLVHGLQVSCGCRKKKGITHEMRKDKANSNNRTSGIKGVCYIVREDKWKAYIYHNHKYYILLSSENKEECVEARKAAEKHINDDFETWYQSFREYITEAKK